MCVICVKPAGVEVPSETRIEDMFKSNSDGAGFMYVRNNKVIIRKGFMKLKHFKRGLAQEGITKDDLLIMHFRIATAGSVSSKNTHPFPLSQDVRDLRALRLETDLAMAHNGILSMTADTKADLSDTMTFVRDVLAAPAVRPHLFEPSITKVLDMSIGASKMVFVEHTGRYMLLGSWVEDSTAKDGCFYSNLIFRSRFVYYTDEDDKEEFPGKMLWEIKYYKQHKRWPVSYFETQQEQRGAKGDVATDVKSEKVEAFAASQEDALVVVDYDAKKCPHCHYPIASHIQLCCSKCGKIFYREHDSVGEVYAH